ncbi:sugar transporter [Aliiroseovarius sp.]|uniref:sugar transporter n=1 Tax=Aliiroseovarius sp. TaxID=1872442 RepID=UPI003BACBDF8
MDKANPDAMKATPEGGGKATPVMRAQPAGPSRMRRRHVGLLRSFYLVVCLPLIVAAGYLYFVAQPQFASTMGFAVRSEEAAAPADLLGGIVSLSGNSSGSDTDVLFEFIRSQRMVRAVDQRMGLRTIWSAPGDPVFGVAEDASVEDLLSYWQRMVKVFYDSSSGLIELRIHAFEPEQAQALGRVIFEESSLLINDLSAIAREDATRYAADELELAVERLRVARQAVAEFRLRTQILDPEADILGRMGLLNSLQEQLASAQIELDIVNQTTSESDPRVERAERRVMVIEERITQERARFSTDEGNEHGAYANLVGEYEGLAVDLQFAQTSYLSALTAFEAARAEALRKSRYLAAYVEPTLAETAEYPQRLLTLLILGGFLFGIWATLTMIYYSVRDRR